MERPTPRADERARPRRRRKRFGQHFLTDQAARQRILAALDVRPQDRVVEIGPGGGALTGGLATAAAAVVAVEIDRDLAHALAQRLPHVRVVRGDALRMRWGWLFGALAATGGRTRVVGNLPYNIATPLMAALFEHAPAVFDFHFMVQAEVADRLVATPGSKAYGRLSVLAQHHCEAERLFEVPPSCFSPPPKVQSSFVRLYAARMRLCAARDATGCDALASCDVAASCDSAALREVLRVCFGQRRKMLGKALRSLQLDAAALGVDPRTRAEQLTVRDFVAIASQYAARQATRNQATKKGTRKGTGK